MEMGDAAQIKKFQAEAEAGKVQMYTDAGVEVQEIFITLNLDREPFNDPLARQILAYGIDTERVCGEGFLGVFPPARGPFDKSSPYFTDTGYPTYDPAKAAELHEQYKAKYGKPLEFESIIPPVNEYQQVAQLVAQMGDEIGVKSNIKTVELTALTAQLVGGQYQASGTILFGSPSLDREYVFIASEPKPSGQLSLNFARNPNWWKVKEWMDKARATDDEQQQIEAYKKVQEQLNEDLPYIWLCHSRSSIVFRNNVHGFDAATIPGTDQLVQQSITPFFYQVWVKR
jgi:ABC-type transport system substrate-binding protein